MAEGAQVMHLEQNTAKICIITASECFLRSRHWNFAAEYLLRSDSSVDLGHWLLSDINPLNAKLNPICHLLALLGTRPILHISRIWVNCVVLSKYTAVQFAVYNTVW